MLNYFSLGTLVRQLVFKSNLKIYAFITRAVHVKIHRAELLLDQFQSDLADGPTLVSNSKATYKFRREVCRTIKFRIGKVRIKLEICIKYKYRLILIELDPLN